MLSYLSYVTLSLRSLRPTAKAQKTLLMSNTGEDKKIAFTEHSVSQPVTEVGGQVSGQVSVEGIFGAAISPRFVVLGDHRSVSLPPDLQNGCGLVLNQCGTHDSTRPLGVTVNQAPSFLTLLTVTFKVSTICRLVAKVSIAPLAV